MRLNSFIEGIWTLKVFFRHLNLHSWKLSGNSLKMFVITSAKCAVIHSHLKMTTYFGQILNVIFFRSVEPGPCDEKRVFVYAEAFYSTIEVCMVTKSDGSA